MQASVSSASSAFKPHPQKLGKRLFPHKPVVAGLVRTLGDDWVDAPHLDRLDRLPTEHRRAEAQPGAVDGPHLGTVLVEGHPHGRHQRRGGSGLALLGHA